MDGHSRNISNLRWFAAFGVYIAVLLVILYWAHCAGRQSLYKLILIFVIPVSCACTFCPLPILPAFIWAGREYNPFLIALLGSLATCMANMHDYYILNSLLKWKKLARAKESHWYARALGWFKRFPFWSLTAANFLPLPIDVVRLLAISTGYSRVPFTLATFIGRYPRYLLLAGVGYAFQFSNRTILIILAVTLGIAAGRGFPKLREKWRAKRVT